MVLVLLSFLDPTTWCSMNSSQLMLFKANKLYYILDVLFFIFLDYFRSIFRIYIAPVELIKVVSGDCGGCSLYTSYKNFLFRRKSPALQMASPQRELSTDRGDTPHIRWV